MKILVLTGSCRKNGNSSKLADAFIEGAKEAGHDVKRVDCGFLKVGGCMACNYCYKHDGVCVQNDDFSTLRQELLDADAVVFASPVYYFGLSAQLKAVIDRFYAMDQALHVPKRTALLLSLADTDPESAAPSIAHHQAFTRYLGWTNAGVAVAYGCTEVEDVLKTGALEEARKLGKTIA